MSSAVTYLRRRTVGRAFRAYREWVGRAVGWWTILYLIAWLVVFIVAGLEALKPLAQPLATPDTFLRAAFGLVFASLVLAGRAPPVILDRRDLYRLGLAPVSPWSALRWRYTLKACGVAALGAALGLLWTAIAPALFGVSTPFAAPALALVLVARFGGAWLVYAREAAGPRGWVLAVLGVAVAVAPYGLVDAFTSGSPLVLVAPLTLATLSVVWARTSLATEWPPRFAAQSLVLTQLQAMRLLQLMAGVAGFIRQAAADGGERRRLLAALHDRPGATRPSRSLPLPDPASPVWRALAWRTATHLWRLPWWRQVVALALVLVAGTAVVAVGGGGAAGAAGAAGSGSAAGLFGSALAVLVAALLTSFVSSGLLGPEFAIGVTPVDPYARTNGRVAPAAGLLLLGSLPAALYLGVGASGLLAALTLVLLVLLTLEKYSSWSGSGAARWEAQVVAALLAALPALVLAALGVPGWTLGAQIGLLAVVALVGV